MTSTVEKVLANILGPHPKKDIDVKNNRTKRSDKYVEPYETEHKDKKTGKKYRVRHEDVDAEHGSRKESEREE